MLMLGKPRGQKEHTQVTRALHGPLPRASPHTPPPISHQLQLHEEAVYPDFLNWTLPSLTFHLFQTSVACSGNNNMVVSTFSATSLEEPGAPSKLNQGIHCQRAFGSLKGDSVSQQMPVLCSGPLFWPLADTLKSSRDTVSSHNSFPHEA